MKTDRTMTKSSEHAQLMAIRDQLEVLRDTHDAGDDPEGWWRIAKIILRTEDAIMELCPHNPDQYHASEYHHEVVECPACRAETDDPEIWQAFVDRHASA